MESADSITDGSPLSSVARKLWPYGIHFGVLAFTGSPIPSSFQRHLIPIIYLCFCLIVVHCYYKRPQFLFVTRRRKTWNIAEGWQRSVDQVKINIGIYWEMDPNTAFPLILQTRTVID